MSKEAIKLALEASKDECKQYAIEQVQEILEQTISEAAKQEQKRPQNCGTSFCSCIECVMDEQEQGEPVAWMREQWSSDCGPYVEIYSDDEMGWRDRKEWIPLYTTPQQRKPLTDAPLYLRNLVNALDNAFISSWQSTHHWAKQLDEARDYLAAHGIK